LASPEDKSVHQDGKTHTACPGPEKIITRLNVLKRHGATGDARSPAVFALVVFSFLYQFCLHLQKGMWLAQAPAYLLSDIISPSPVRLM